MSDHVVSKDGTRLAYERSGSGPPLILIDGALCSRAFGPSAKLAGELARGFTVYRYDRRVRGDERRHAELSGQTHNVNPRVCSQLPRATF